MYSAGKKRAACRCGQNNTYPDVEQIKEALIKEPPGNADLFRLARRDLFFETGVDSSVLDCFKESEATPPNRINQRFLKIPKKNLACYITLYELGRNASVAFL